MKEFDRLTEIVKKLRNPEKGCPWDLKQTSKSLIPNFIEELYEAVEEIEKEDYESLAEELGDLMLHIVMQVRIAEEENHFSMEDVLTGISEKLIRRHPHIFSSPDNISADEVKKNWEQIKQSEKKEIRKSLLDGIPFSMPGLIVAQRMQEKAASAGFDWDSPELVFDKIDEEITEIKEAVANNNQDEIEEEIGDLLFSAVNLARKLNADSETALRRAIKKFKVRFNKIEEYHHRNGENIYESSLEKLDEIWTSVKRDV
ncbi:MAG: nucleoside triphosphate pyrophosphohydrolase [Candidatus Cloacimonadota bacterium]|nr:MAG: nucleoside triphosphate pyrophosphohydrolase [Candidatus Cloacimonadota bacterium]